jgi:hypothetical protein
LFFLLTSCSLDFAIDDLIDKVFIGVLTKNSLQ